MPVPVAIVPSSHREESESHHYSPGVRVGTTLYVSGQIGVDADGQPFPDPEAQFVAAFGRLEAVLEEAGFRLDQIVDLTTFHPSFDDMALFMTVRDRYLLGPTFPCWTAVTAGLALPGALVEIKCVAITNNPEN